MSRKAPGKAYRGGISIIELTEMFPDEQAAKDWFVQQRWDGGRFCLSLRGNANDRPRRSYGVLVP